MKQDRGKHLWYFPGRLPGKYMEVKADAGSTQRRGGNSDHI